MGSRSFSVGNFTRTAGIQENEFDQRVKDLKTTSHVSNLDGEDPETWSAERVKAAAEMFMRNDQRTQDGLTSQENARTWIALRPEYHLCPENSAIMQTTLVAMGCSQPYTTKDLDTAFGHCKALLKLNHNVIVEQQKKEAQQRAAVIKEEDYDESKTDSYYQLPLEEIRRRAGGTGNGWL